MTLSRERCRGTLHSHNNSEEGSKKVIQTTKKLATTVVADEHGVEQPEQTEHKYC